MIQETVPHTLNVLVHVVFGTVALLLGAWQLARPKGDARHRTVGRFFLVSVWIVVATAALGLTVFRFGAFLAVLTLLVAYWSYSGMRALAIRETGPERQDAVVSICALGAVALFVAGLPFVRFPWVPSVIYSSLLTLTSLAVYDLARFTFPNHWFGSLWLYEHAVKVTGAHGAIVAAFAGTVLPTLQPYSQIIPPIIWTVLQIAFVIRLRRGHGARRPVASAPWTTA